MNKKNQITYNITNFSIRTILLSAFIYLIYSYSINIGLFEKFDIQINGNEYINDFEIRNKIYPQINSSLLSVDLAEIKNNLESIDYIETVQVSRILPNRLIIYIIERTPILIINKNDNFSFIDKNGVLLPVEKKSFHIFAVPLISINDDYGSINGYKKDITQIFEFILTEYPAFYENLSKINIKSDVWEFYCTSNTKIFTHPDFLINQLHILKDFEKTVSPTKKLQDYSYIDLRIKNQIIVKEKYRKG